MSGFVSHDVAEFGGAKSNMGFGEIQKVDGITFLVSQMAGIVGLGYDSISVNNLPTFISNSDLSEKSFSFYMKNNPEQSIMVMPGYLEEGYEMIKKHNVIEKTYWNLKLDNFHVNDKTISTTGFKAAIDSGTSLIVGPADILDPLVNEVGEVAQDCSNVTDLPDITFEIDNHMYVLTSQDYILQVEQFGNIQCLMGIMSMATPDGFDYVIVGDVFFRKFNPFFNREDDTVTFFKETSSAEFLQ